MRGRPDANCKLLAEVLEEELQALGQPVTKPKPESTEQQRLEAIFTQIHALEPGRSALCLSGGGIRSAVYGLGILQGLARLKLLQQFDYLSTVSGGGYAGAWLSAWIKNGECQRSAAKQDPAAGRNEVFELLKNEPPRAPLKPEPDPISHLRTFSNYLTPKLGLLSADTWTLAAIFIRNLLLNWLVLLSWLAVVLVLPRFSLLAIMAQPNPAALCLTAAAGLVLFSIACGYAIFDLPGLGNARLSQNCFLLFYLLPLFGAVLCFTAWWAGFYNTGGAGPELEFIAFPGRLGQFFQHPPPAAIAFAQWLFLSSVVGCLGGGAAVYLHRATRETWLERGWGLNARRFVSALLLTGAMAALAGIALWALAFYLFRDPAQAAWNYTVFGPSLVLAVFLLSNILLIGLVNRVSDDEDREWWGRSSAWMLIALVGWTLWSGLVLWGAGLVFSVRDAIFDKHQTIAAQIVAGIVAACGGVVGLITALAGFSRKTPAQEREVGTKESSQWRLAIATILFFLFLSLALSNLFDPTLAMNLWEDWQKRVFLQQHLGATGFFLLVGLMMGCFINVNQFSLHAIYRSRLIRAFLGASRPANARRAHRFTGFDPHDDLAMHELSVQRPLHVVNIALNIVDDHRLGWQERKAASFTVSRLHAGNWNLGYRPVDRFGGEPNPISLGTAIAISGAAANPNMGYHSSPLVSFLMTLFNLRFGWWLGNPRDKAWTKSGPSYSVWPLLAEAVGATSDRYTYVNLSDGGHFDNLGLYEMILRRCHYVVVVDAGRDTEYVFEDLGNALRKVRVDFGISIDIKVISPKKAEKGTPGLHCAIGRIEYSAVSTAERDGYLIYIKPVLTGDEPADVANYAAAHPEFPHETTSDQWFSESQLESYRMLGCHAVQQMCGRKHDFGSLEAFFRHVDTYKSAKVMPQPEEGEEPLSWRGQIESNGAEVVKTTEHVN